jgi:serine/threonine-protein kinase
MQGQVLAGKYRLVALLGQGGMGSVWRAEHVELGTPTAIKLIDSSIATTSEGLTRFRREAQAAAALRSANIVQIFDFGIDNGTPYIAMELLVGQSLAGLLERERCLTPERTVELLGVAAKAIGYAHSLGYVHRDLKPDNIFLADEAGETIVKLLDFGIAKVVSANEPAGSMTRTGAMMGTPYYMSPEQASGKRTVDHRADIWAFGVIAFECLTGKRPFDSETLGGLVLAICIEPSPRPSSVASVPAGFDQWFDRAAHRDPEQRFASMSDAMAALRQVCQGSGAIYSPNAAHSALQNPSAQSRIVQAITNGTNTTTGSPASVTIGSQPKRQGSPWIFGGLFGAVTVGALFAALYVFAFRPATVTAAASSASPDSATAAPTLRAPEASPSGALPVELSPVDAAIAASAAVSPAPVVVGNRPRTDARQGATVARSVPPTSHSPVPTPPPPPTAGGSKPTIEKRLGF